MQSGDKRFRGETGAEKAGGGGWSLGMGVSLPGTVEGGLYITRT